MLALEFASAIDGLAARRCCGLAFSPCGRLLLLLVAAALLVPITPIDHGRQVSTLTSTHLVYLHAYTSGSHRSSAGRLKHAEPL